MRKLEPGLFACYLWFENESLNISLWKSESLCCLHCANEIAFSSCYLQCERDNLIFYLCDLGTQDENLNISLCCLPCAWKWNSHKFARVFDMWRWKAQRFAMFLQYESWNLDFSLVFRDLKMRISTFRCQKQSRCVICNTRHTEMHNFSPCCLQCEMKISAFPYVIREPKMRQTTFRYVVCNVH